MGVSVVNIACKDGEPPTLERARAASDEHPPAGMPENAR
jgi:hypothetical protein